jgi:hypothetical protein
MTFSANSLGRAAEPPSHQHPILFIGDSFTMGVSATRGVALVATELSSVTADGSASPERGIGDSRNVWVKLLRDHARPRRVSSFKLLERSRRQPASGY